MKKRVKYSMKDNQEKKKDNVDREKLRIQFQEDKESAIKFYISIMIGLKSRKKNVKSS